METPRITPEPGESERRAILAALAAEEAEEQTVSAWAGALLPPRDPAEQNP